MEKTLLFAAALAFSGAAWGTAPAAFGTVPAAVAACAAVQRAAGTTAFSADLRTATALGDWKAADANTDGATWAVAEGIAGITYDSDKAAAGADDWLFTPAFTVSEGTDYLVAFTVRRQASFEPDRLEICAGHGTTPAAMTKKLATVSVDKEIEEVTYSYRFTADKGGDDMHVGFRVSTEGGSNGQLSLLSASVTSTEKCTPAAVTELTADMSHRQKTVVLKWKNPKLDVNGVAINEPMSVEVKHGYTTLATLSDQQPGSEGSYTYSKDDFSGLATFSVTAVLGENRSQEAVITVNLDDLQGDSVIVKAFNVNRNNSDQWAVEGKGQAWHYDYDNVFEYNHRKAGSQADEWLISPSVTLETGKRYVLAYELKTGRDYGNDLEVTMGEGATAASQIRTLVKYSDLKQNGFGEYTSPQFAVEKTGSYNIGFHATSADYYVSMRNLRVYYIREKEETAINAVGNAQQPESVSVYDITGRLVGKASADGARQLLSGAAHGIYVVRTTTADGQTTSKKVMK